MPILTADLFEFAALRILLCTDKILAITFPNFKYFLRE